MTLTLLIWLGIFCLQAALLGRTIYAIVTFSDLESDFINPYDLTSRLNRFVLVEYGGQALLTALLLASRHWIAAALHAALLAYLLQLALKKQHLIDTTDVFKQLPVQKKRRLILFGFYVLTFVYSAYMLIEIAIHTALTPEGREQAKRLLHEAAASMY